MILVHGGSGAVAPERHDRLRAGVRAAAAVGHAILAAGGSALDAVVAAVRVLEDDPELNAGVGSALTRDSLRFSGIPDGWIELQVLLELGRGGQTFIHLRLLVRHWDENLLRYTVAFQRRLRAEIERFEPSARDWLLSITWQYLVDDEAPCLDLPDPATWGSPLSELPKAEQTRGDDVEEDLARLFAVRDANLAAPSDPGPDKYHRKV